jgi:effector-binding domain-containing protein
LQRGYRRLVGAGLGVRTGVSHHNGESVRVFAGIPVDAEPGDRDGVAVVELPAVERAATLLHHGSMDVVMPSYEALAGWVEENGLRGVSASREVTLHRPADPDGWVTELQLLVADCEA